MGRKHPVCGGSLSPADPLQAAEDQNIGKQEAKQAGGHSTQTDATRLAPFVILDFQMSKPTISGRPAQSVIRAQILFRLSGLAVSPLAQRGNLLEAHAML